ncbi:ABC transporter substrate-binding protein [Anaerotignum sp.]
MRKRIIAFLMAMLMVISAAACGNAEPAETVQNAEGAYPVIITDHADREVTIEEEPQTIISGYYITTSMLIGLGQAEKLVGVENTPEKRPVYGLSAPNILELPTLGTVKEFDLEKCAAIDPDLVILPYKLKDITPSLEQLGIPVLVVKPETQELLAETIAMLGVATGCTGKVVEMQTFIDEKLAELEIALADTESPSVYLGGNSSLLSTAGTEMYQHCLIENAGGSNVAAELTDTYWAEISYEQLLAWDPEYIILAADASYSVEDVLNDKVLANCTAVKNGNVYRIPNAIECWDSPVPGSVLGSLWLATVLHGDVYAMEQYEAAVTEFYETFYGFTPELD